jgi:hypothetical protein
LSQHLSKEGVIWLTFVELFECIAPVQRSEREADSAPAMTGRHQTSRSSQTAIHSARLGGKTA